MDNLGDWDVDPHELARPYITGPLPIMDAPLAITAGSLTSPPAGPAASGPPADEGGASAFTLIEPSSPPEATGGPISFTLIEPARPAEHDTAPLPAIGQSRRRRAGETDGRRPPRAGTARRWLLTVADRGPVMIGAAAMVVAVAGGLVLLITHSATTAGKCRQGGCAQAASRPSGTVLPAILPASLQPSATPPSAVSTRPAAVTTTAPATTVVTATPRPSVTSTVASPTPSPSATTPGLAPGSWVSVQATTACCTSFYIRHDDQDNRVVITQVTSASSGTDKADATWVVQAGLADRSCVSFESANQPGQYLRHYDFELYLEPSDGSAQFAEDATFCPRPGNSGQGYSLQSVNYPYKYIRHYDYVVYIASDGGSNPWDTPTLWPDDTTWRVDQPWASGTSSGSPGCGRSCRHP